jgi:predicted transposase/invertase (TIGR01784 family)
MSKKTDAMSPLADPVVGAIFDGVENAGLAAQSLVGSILAEDGVKIGKVTAVTPQRYYKDIPLMRGCRVDILVESENSPKTLVEVQMSEEPIMARNMFEYAHAIVSSVPQGILTVDLYNAVPKIVVINICNFPVRTTGNNDFLQPVKQMYTKNPEVAQDYLNIYNVQLPNFRESEHDLTKPLHAWLFILDTANQKGITVKEVIDMFPELNEVVTTDPGFGQFMHRYDSVTSDPEVRKEYDMFMSEKMRMSGILFKAQENVKLETARNMLLDGVKPEKVSQYTLLPLETIQEIRLNP